MADNPKICRYMDIPLQHISDKVLDMMHRNVDGAWTRELIRKMREKVPGVVLRTTMIVGHPGEGVKEFNELLDFVRQARIERLGAFKYSEEEGTYGAENFRDSIPDATKQKRLDRLMSIQSEISLEFNQSRIGTEDKVIVELKSVSDMKEVYGKQLFTYLKISHLKLGLLVNFNSSDIRSSIHRIVNHL